MVTDAVITDDAVGGLECAPLVGVVHSFHQGGITCRFRSGGRRVGAAGAEGSHPDSANE